MLCRWANTRPVLRVADGAERQRRRYPQKPQAGLNELLGEYKTATEFRVRGVKILDALLAADHPVRVAAFDNLLKSLDTTLVPGQPRMLPLEETLMWQRLGLDRAARLHDRRRMQMEDRVQLSAALSRAACSLTEQGRFPVRKGTFTHTLRPSKPMENRSLTFDGTTPTTCIQATCASIDASVLTVGTWV